MLLATHEQDHTADQKRFSRPTAQNWPKFGLTGSSRAQYSSGTGEMFSNASAQVLLEARKHYLLTEEQPPTRTKESEERALYV